MAEWNAEEEPDGLELGAFEADAAREITSLADAAHLRVHGDVYEAARLGDLPRLRQHVEVHGANVQDCDVYGGTALYYAALCGHIDCVRYLISRGAICDANDWLGERVHYAALTDDIRRELVAFAVVNKQRGPLMATTARLFNNCNTRPDVVFIVCADGGSIHAHKAILSARSAYMRDRFAPGGRWEHKRVVQLTDGRQRTPALACVIEYLYTERLVCERGHVAQVRAIAVNLGLWDAVRAIDADSAPVGDTGEGAASAHVEDAQRMLAVDLGLPYTLGEPPSAPGLRMEFWTHLLHGIVLPPHTAHAAYGYDVDLVVDGVAFHAHAVFLAQRSSYFTSMLRFHSDAHAQGQNDAPLCIELDSVSASVFAAVLEYLYTDSLPAALTAQEVLEAMAFADLTMLHDGIKSVLVQRATALIDADTVVAFLRAAETYGFYRLTSACAKFAADRLESTLQDDDFIALVRESAAAVTDRQQFDSVPVLDELMHVCRQRVSPVLRARMHADGTGAEALPPEDAAVVRAYAEQVALITAVAEAHGLHMRQVVW